MGCGNWILREILAQRTAVLGLGLYELIGILVGSLIAGGTLILLCVLRFGKRREHVKHASGLILVSVGDIVEGFVGGEDGEHRVGAVVLFRGGGGGHRGLQPREGDRGGILPDLSVVAVKNLLDSKGQAEEFKVEVEAIGKVRYKNLVGLIGYYAKGAIRIQVYEYIDNGTLEHWLHRVVGSSSPLTWDIRMKISIGTAKGYLHEGIESKVVHRDIKSLNILLDKQWNPKVSDFGLAKLLESDSSYVTTRVMGTFGYVAPEYVSTGMLYEGSDVYSFGVLLMGVISGRSPVDYRRPSGEVNLVDWFNGMVGSRRVEEVVDPLIEVQPSPKFLKRVLLIFFRCVNLGAQERPKMRQTGHMLEEDESPFRKDDTIEEKGKIGVRKILRCRLLSELYSIYYSQGVFGSRIEFWRFLKQHN